jgi:hypothetical protein
LQKRERETAGEERVAVCFGQGRIASFCDTIEQTKIVRGSARGWEGD